jgi:hypothetical protein
MMFYLTDQSGAVTGPHLAGVLVQRLEKGEMRWDDAVCVHGSEEWVPAKVYAKELGSRGQRQGGGFVCGSCGSGRIQKVKVIYETGTTNSMTRGQGVGGVFDDGVFDPVVGVSTHRTTSMTVAAARCAPPRREDYVPKDSSAVFIVGGGLVLLFALFMLITGPGILAALFGIVGGCSVLGGIIAAPSAKAKRMAEAYYIGAVAEWEARYYCHQCGTMGRAVNAG